ncbi:MAG: glycosyltransferase family 4 protein [Gemmataceae bacterium]
MQIVALVDAPDHVCCRYRLAAFRPHLEAAGHALELVRLPRSWWRRLLLFRRLRGATVVVQRQLMPPWQVAVLRAGVRHLLFDFDDAVWLRDSYAIAGLHHPRKARRFAAIVRACDAVVAGNGFLASQAARYLPADRVHIVPTCVDPDRYRPRRDETAGDGRELVWIGSSSTLQGLQRIAPLLNELGRSVPGLRLKVICDRFPRFDALPVVDCPWSAATEADELAAADVGISWIPDDLWSRGKCGLKVLQYMAAGLPVLANPVGVHPEMVEPGQTGFLPATPDEWVDAVRRLIADAELRRTMGKEGRARFERHYSIAAGAQGWLAVLARLEGGRAQAG